MKILALAPYKFLPAENGGQKAIEGLYTSLAKKVDLTCVSTWNNDLSKDHGFELLPLFSNSKFRYVDVFSLYSLAKFIRRRGITHIIIEHPYMGWLALMLKKITGVKFIVHSHNIEGQRFASMNKWWATYLAAYEKKVHQHADLSLFITNEDRSYAITRFSLDNDKTMVVPFAVNLNIPPTWEEKAATKLILCDRHSISSERNLLIFAAAFNYTPNLEALNNLINFVLPELNNRNYNCHLLVCGKDVPGSVNKNSNAITFTGFVENIYEYYRGADLFVNPVTKGGGIKTKLVEALGNNCNAVSTATGAVGIPETITYNKLMVAPDNDWKLFAELIIKSEQQTNTPAAFYDYFNADKIADEILRKAEQL